MRSCRRIGLPMAAVAILGLLAGCSSQAPDREPGRKSAASDSKRPADPPTVAKHVPPLPVEPPEAIAPPDPLARVTPPNRDPQAMLAPPIAPSPENPWLPAPPKPSVGTPKFTVRNMTGEPETSPWMPPEGASPGPRAPDTTPLIAANPPTAMPSHRPSLLPGEGASQPHITPLLPGEGTGQPHITPLPPEDAGNIRAMAKAGSPDKPSDASTQAAEIKLFYATDRGRADPAELDRAIEVRWLVWTLTAGGATLILTALALRRRAPAPVLRTLAGAAGATTVLIGGIALWTFVAGRMTADAGPSRIYYGGERGELELGTCTVSIPRTHRVGDLESPSVLKLEFREDPSRHVMLVGVEPQPADEFFSDLRAKVDRSSERAAFVFVHGYNVTFDDAARRTAQVAYDLNYDGAPILYSWPSQGKLSGYTVDENNVEWTVPHLKQFLLDLAGRSGAAQIHLVAHSMGNRALADALRQLAYENPPARPLFREVILTAPDIDAEVFRRDLAPAIARTADRVTLYASSNDEALALSKQVHGYPRAGDSGGQLVVVPGIDTIDVSAVDTSLMGHSYYGSNDTVLADMFALIHQSMPPDKRRWLRSERLGMLRYWIFERR